MARPVMHRLVCTTRISRIRARHRTRIKHLMTSRAENFTTKINFVFRQSRSIISTISFFSPNSRFVHAENSTFFNIKRANTYKCLFRGFDSKIYSIQRSDEDTRIYLISSQIFIEIFLHKPRRTFRYRKICSTKQEYQKRRKRKGKIENRRMLHPRWRYNDFNITNLPGWSGACHIKKRKKSALITTV